MRLVLLVSGDLDMSDVEGDEVVMDLMCRVNAKEGMRDCALRSFPKSFGIERVAKGRILLY